MLSRITTITFNELRVVAPRVALYTAVAYATIRAAGFVADQASRLMGMDDSRRS